MSAAPEADTVERWAWDYVLSTSLAYELSPPPPPDAWSSQPAEFIDELERWTPDERGP
ncbi:MAG: hypothetical protein L6Q84_32820 [Polyangiaceae bacterium]|nr:hypothetical protein [Polyangiaceae bacterium]